MAGMNAHDEKPWWQSQTVVGLMVSITCKGLALIGYEVDAEQWTVLSLALLAIGADLVAWWGRVQATRVISKVQILPGLTLMGRQP
ncbi:MAG: hypothetical protein RL375_491 [Pseudomonadota bacterium]|jgi:hypothetical protein